jgi:hypothetical protein
MNLRDYRARLAIARRHARNAADAADLLREARWAEARPGTAAEDAAPGASRDVLRRLSEGTRRVAVLALHGLNADEIQYVLGLKPRRLDGHDGPFALARAGTIELVFIPRNEPAGRTPIVVFGLQSGIYEVVESLAARGVEIVVPVSETPDGGLSADFRDPDGHILSVYQPGGAPT